MTFLRILVLFLLILPIFPVAGSNAQPTSKHWQETKSINANFKAISAQPDIEVFTAPNIIMIKVNRETDIRLFTILGKLVSSEHLQPGIFEYHLDSHGIYIIKTDESSSKIAI